MEYNGNSAKERTEIIDAFLKMLEEDLLHWDFCKELKDERGILRIYQKLTRNGKPIAASETYVRCSCLVRDTKPE